jgi:cytochrome c oxidase assembly protein subunit 15
VFVCLQGWLGGGRVTLDARVLAFIHGVTGQLFFALMVALAAFLSVSWVEGPAPSASARCSAQRTLTSALLLALLLQLAMGAAARHFTRDGAPHMHALIAHATFSVVVVTLAALVGMRTKSMAGDARPGLRRIGAALNHTAGLQMALGVAALWAVLAHQKDDPTVELLLATAHQTIGALLLGLATLNAVWARRAFAPDLD